MKKVLTVIMFFVLITVNAVHAQTNSSPSATVVPTESAEEEQIQTLKEKIATKVAELRKENLRAISGRVTANEGNTIKITTEDNTQYTIKTDESLTHFFKIEGAGKTEIKQDTIKSGMYIIVDGVLSENTIEANSVYVDVLYLVRVGTIIEVNAADFTIRVVGTDKETYTLDIQTDTRQQLLNTTTLLGERIGFSKIKENDIIHFVVEKTGTEKEPNRYNAVKILVIPQEYFVTKDSAK